MKNILRLIIIVIFPIFAFTDNTVDLDEKTPQELCASILKGLEH